MRAGNKKAMGERARAARMRLGLNQSDVAERVGISNEVYGRFERGLVSPRLATLLRFCEVLEVEPNDLLWSDAKPDHRRNDATSFEIRRLAQILKEADPATIRRVADIARWLQVPTRAARRKRRANP
jgi:transcriptional regulator with XRE-family HTH domain